MAPARTTGSSGERSIVVDDRLSSLPDALLHNVLSFVTARQAVQTCVLSRRWECLWCSMPCLDINEREFRASAIEPESDTEDEDDPDCARFEDFVSNLLMFHNAPTLDRFRLHLTWFHETEVDRWIQRGMMRFPRVVEISCKSSFFEFPHLGSGSSCLNRLHLARIRLDRPFTQLLRSGCPVLQELKLEWCTFHYAEIASCTLKNLIIEDCMTDCLGVLTIKAPSVSYFQLVIMVAGWNWGGVIVDEMPSLIKATIRLSSHYFCSNELPELPCNLLHSITNVKDLELSGFLTLAILHAGLNTFPVFRNLRTLLFDECDLSDNFEILGCFLNNAPILEKLTLQHCQLPEGSQKRKTREDPKRISLKCKDTLTLQCPSLKWTEINYEEDDVHQLFGLLLGIWRNLQKTTIVLNKS